MNSRAQAILDFWFVETPSEKRFKKDQKLDQLIREKFLNDYEKASLNEYDDWQDTALGSLALVILFDQFSRNMFRDQRKAFEQDSKTRLIVHYAIKSDFMKELDQSQRFFMLLPLIHSEEMFDHEMAYHFMDLYLQDHSDLVDIKKFWKDHTKAIKTKRIENSFFLLFSALAKCWVHNTVQIPGSILRSSKKNHQLKRWLRRRFSWICKAPAI